MSEKKVITLKKVAKKKSVKKDGIPNTDVSFHQSIDLSDKRRVSVGVSRYGCDKDVPLIGLTLYDKEDGMTDDTVLLSKKEATMLGLALDRAVRMTNTPKYLFRDGSALNLE